MGKIESFEDLKVWQKARKLTNLLYDVTSRFPREERFNLIDQLRRAGVSTMSNIAEGFSCYHTAETIMFYRNARGSLSEVKSLLYISFDRKYINRKNLERLVALVDEIGKMLNGLIKSTASFRNTKR